MNNESTTGRVRLVPLPGLPASLAGDPMTKAEKARLLLDEANALSQDVVTDLMDSIARLKTACEEAAALEMVRPGVRERARQLATTLHEEGLAIQALQERDL